MPRPTLSRILPQRAHIMRRWFLRPFRAVLHDPALWATHRRNVLRAMTVGLLICFIPFPIHTALAGVLAVILRVNLPVAILASWLSNPLTFGPMYYAAYRIGLLVLGMPPADGGIEFTAAGIVEDLSRAWRPLLVGCAISGTALAGLSYLLLNRLWISAARRRFHRRAENRRPR